MVRHKASEFYYFIFFILVYIVTTYGFAPHPTVLHKYHLSVLSYRFIVTTIVVPIIAIWLVAFYGYAKLRRYAGMIRHSRDGKPVAKLTYGIMVLVFSLPINSIISTVARQIGQTHAGFLPSSTIITNYVALIFPLLAFWFMSYGARELTEVVRARPSQRAILMLILAFITIGTGYCYFVFGGAAHLFHVADSHRTIYYLPDWLLLFTLVVPYVFVWFMGLLTTYELFLFQSKVKGVLYRKAWSLLAVGVSAIVVVSIVLQYIVTLTTRVNQLTFNSLLLIVYGLLISLSVGYVLVAMGAKRLQKIEEV